jgi:hypothetical protein
MLVVAFGFKNHPLKIKYLINFVLMYLEFFKKSLRRIKSIMKESGNKNIDFELMLSIKSLSGVEHYNKAESIDVFGIVFSKDRALQLNGLLGSYVELVTELVPLIVIYHASTDEHEAAYSEVFRNYSKFVKSKPQKTRKEFKELLIATLSETNAKNVFFLVDDNMFIESIDIKYFASLTSRCCVPSLRMGKNLTRSYTLQREQPLPQFYDIHAFDDEQMHAWLWNSGVLDWNYPLSVDGHFFARIEILEFINSLNFDSPNRFEEELQKFHVAFSWRLGICYSKSKLINIPYNKVQTDIDNIHGTIHQDDMLIMWNQGYRIDTKYYYGTINESAHKELPLQLVRETLEKRS